MEDNQDSRKKILGKFRSKESKKDNLEKEKTDDAEIEIEGFLSRKEFILQQLVNTVKKNNSSNRNYAFQKINDSFDSYLKFKAKKYFIQGASIEDVIQEGRIGLFKAVTDFDSSRGESFVKFACMCVERHLISTIKRGLRQKSSILNQSDSLDKEVYQSDDSGEGVTLLEFIPNDESEIPENSIISKERHDIIKNRLFKRLTVMEREVTDQYLRGYSYEKISDILNINTKSVDNALSRAKNKAEEIDISDILND